MRPALLVLLPASLIALNALAQPDWQADLLDLAQDHSDRVERQDAIHQSIAHLHPDVLAVTADTLGVDPAALPARMREGYAASKRMIRILSHDIYPATALFGEVEGWRWAAVPQRSRSEFREGGASVPNACRWLFLFTDGQHRYYNGLTGGRTDDLVRAGLPAPLGAVVPGLPEPHCGAPVS